MSAAEFKKCVYKTSTAEYFVMIDETEYKKWQEDKSIPLVDVVESFAVFEELSNNPIGKPSKATLENVFGSSKDVDVIIKILAEGTVKSGAMKHGGGTSTNDSEGAQRGMNTK